MLVSTLLVHSVESQLAQFVGPAAVDQTWESDEQGVGPASRHHGNWYPRERGHRGRARLHGHILP